MLVATRNVSQRYVFGGSNWQPPVTRLYSGATLLCELTPALGRSAVLEKQEASACLENSFPLTGRPSGLLAGLSEPILITATCSLCSGRLLPAQAGDAGPGLGFR